eukprot:scaffold385049_cov38-Prasinocladus_malaysianus.AAC.1
MQHLAVPHLIFNWYQEDSADCIAKETWRGMTLNVFGECMDITGGSAIERLLAAAIGLRGEFQ